MRAQAGFGSLGLQDFSRVRSVRSDVRPAERTAKTVDVRRRADKARFRARLSCTASEGTQIESEVEGVAKKIADKVAEGVSALKGPNNRLIVGITGGPGSGKTTTVMALSKILESRGIHTESLPMDGFHYYRHELDRFEDPVEAHRRRGAPFTFDAKRFIDTLAKVKEMKSRVLCPGFDHSVKDPEEEKIVIDDNIQVSSGPLTNPSPILRLWPCSSACAS